MSATVKGSLKKATFGTSAEELFSNLSINESAEQNVATAPRPLNQRSGTLPLQGHRPSRSQEDEKRLRNGSRGPPRPRGPPRQKSLLDSPERSENRRPRRNSESSMIDKGSLNPEEERKRRERRKEREAGVKDGKSRSGRSKRPNGLDLIDKLDVTGIYGPGLFHHDGPFDACNPHRNRRKDHRAPMQAFPANSANNAIGGTGPVNKNIDLEKFHGRGAEGFTDFATSGADNYESYGKRRPSLEGRSLSFNPKDRVEPIHGEETVGLGTSTFLEGAPASRTAIQRRESENEAAALQNASLGRKKSIAQRIRGISQPRRGFGPEFAPRITSPELRYEVRPSGANGIPTPDSPPQALPKGPQSAGGSTKAFEKNPFFDDYDDAYEKKGASIKTAGADAGGAPTPPAKSPTSPIRNALERRLTADSVDGVDGGRANAGFLSRVKSLKGKKTRPERRPS